MAASDRAAKLAHKHFITLKAYLVFRSNIFGDMRLIFSKYTLDKTNSGGSHTRTL